MGALTFVRLSEIDEGRIIELMNNERVGRRLPLLRGAFSSDDCRAFLSAKQRLWDEHGFGPWAFLVDGAFAGWGGLQPEQGEADFALVLHPEFWGWGRRIFTEVRDHAFGPMGLASITILLPPSRPNAKAVRRLGFAEDGWLIVGGERFTRFRLARVSSPDPDAESQTAPGRGPAPIEADPTARPGSHDQDLTTRSA